MCVTLKGHPVGIVYIVKPFNDAIYIAKKVVGEGL